MMSTLTVSETGTYSVVALNEDGCRVKDTIDLVQLLDPVVDLGIDTTVCDTAGFTLDAGSGASYLWSDGSMNQTLAVPSSGNYSVVVTDGNGCTGTDSVEVEVINCFPTSIGDDLVEFVTAVYPNPSQGIITLEFGDIAGELVNLNVCINYKFEHKYQIEFIYS